MNNCVQQRIIIIIKNALCLHNTSVDLPNSLKPLYIQHHEMQILAKQPLNKHTVKDWVWMEVSAKKIIAWVYEEESTIFYICVRYGYVLTS